jgi:hypothetical protein
MASCGTTPHIHVQHRLLCCSEQHARCQICTSILYVRELLHQAKPSLQLLILHGRVCGCTATAVDGLWVDAAMCRDTTAYSSEIVCSECLALYATWPPDWPFCDWQVSEACHSSGATTCVLLVGSGHSHVKGLFLSCSLLWSLKLVWGAQLVSGCARGPLLTTVRSSHKLNMKFPQLSYSLLHTGICCKLLVSQVLLMRSKENEITEPHTDNWTSELSV